MNGRAIFDFAAKHGPTNLSAMLAKNFVTSDEVDLFLFHQGSKYIVDTLTKRSRIDKSKVPFAAGDYGNTVSSTIPIMLGDILTDQDIKTIAISGFGVGLSIASTILFRN
jgi:3-oxoacyl-[acyl-carrier-protein] synthase-3